MGVSMMAGKMMRVTSVGLVMKELHANEEQYGKEGDVFCMGMCFASIRTFYAHMHTQSISTFYTHPYSHTRYTYLLHTHTHLGTIYTHSLYTPTASGIICYQGQEGAQGPIHVMMGTWCCLTLAEHVMLR